MSSCVGISLILRWSVFVRLRVPLSLCPLVLRAIVRFRAGLVSVCGASCCVPRSSCGLVAVVERFTVNPNYSSQILSGGASNGPIYVCKAVVMESV
ncbi:hypothetical protein C2E23DRAFT_824021 [Lenzites betulinus]|nr:hypothetical protein C2E23DRAFT_824021 [Lenzites betulinus]